MTVARLCAVTTRTHKRRLANRILALTVTGLFAALLGSASLAHADEVPDTVAGWFDLFADDWSEQDWMTRRPGGRATYMRPLEEEGWKSRWRALQGIVALGEAAVEPLLAELASDDVDRRTLAAQALGYLAPAVPVEPLLSAAEDEEAVVRLYAVDALGMRGDPTLGDELKALLEVETNRDVKQHIGYALARGEHGVDAETVQQLLATDASQSGTAAVGQPAPEFTLGSLTGETVSLSDFRGQQYVVLVFIYGDT